MSRDEAQERLEAKGVRERGLAGDAALVLIIVAGLASVFALSQRLEATRPPQDPFAAYEELYVAPETARRLSLGLNGLVADWYWLRSLQYVGRKMDAYKERFSLDDMRPLGIRNLGALLEQATTLDPQFMAAYEFGAVVLPSIDRDAAVRLIEKGIKENPREWRLYQHLGYIHWQAGRYAEASKAYRAGAALEGAPPWMSVLAAQVEVYGGSREVAREMYARMHDESDDPQVRALAVSRLLQIRSLEERDRLREVLAEFQRRTSRCPSDWRDLSRVLRAMGLDADASGSPLDPTGFPYVLDPAACDVKLHEHSGIPKK